MKPNPPRTVLESITRRRFLLSDWPWRSLGYLLTATITALAALVPLSLILLPWAAVAHDLVVGGSNKAPLVPLVLVGAVFIAVGGPLVALPIGAVERWRLRMIDVRPVTSGHRYPGVGLLSWLRTRYTETATLRELVYAVLLAFVLPILYGALALLVMFAVLLVFSPLFVHSDGGPVTLVVAHASTPVQALPFTLIGLVLLPVLPYAFALVAGVQGVLARVLLHDGAAPELAEVEQSRARLADSFAAERRRIERDLHDGAQQRLVSLTLQLGLAQLDLPPGSPGAGAVAGAHQQAKQLMEELREFIHGIHPQILTDSGLPAALQELVARVPVPVTLDVDLPERPPARVETTAYFAVAEALTNVARHSGATAATVTAWRTNTNLLVVEVVDNGHGGADPRAGSGLTGLADRLAAVDGRMLLSSPEGGPTRVRLEMPCR
jgi:signal transduction histidine kinase